jgi:hypothetical protein
MDTLKARVVNGRLVLDEPTSLPEGTELELSAADPGDNLDDSQRAQLHAALERSWEQLKAGKVTTATDAISELRRRR